MRIDEPHVHDQIWEVYLVARGLAEIRVDQQTVALEVGDGLVVEPGEAHTFLSSSPDYLHFVLHSSVPESGDKRHVSREQLGLS